MWLEDYLKDYQGALLLVSHDRYFLDRLCTSVCEIERGRLTRYKGNYTTFTQLKEAAVARQWKEYEMQQRKSPSWRTTLPATSPVLRRQSPPRAA